MATTLFAQDNAQQQQQQFLVWTQQCLSFLVVGALWGCSNAVMKQCTEQQQQEGEKAAAGPGQKSTNMKKGVWAGLQALIGTKVSTGTAAQRNWACNKTTNKGASMHGIFFSLYTLSHTLSHTHIY
jgi:hypothetical protein